MFEGHILTLVGLNVRINHEINNFCDLTVPLSMNGTLFQIMASDVIPDQCSLKCSHFIIGKMVTTDINDFGAMVTNYKKHFFKNSSTHTLVTL